MRRLLLWILVLGITPVLHAQDPAFSQFFSSPLNINPALTGNINGDWRAIANYRDQWITPASPYSTGTASFDTKLLKDRMPNTPEPSYFSLGIMLMHDHDMAGIVKGNYASANISYCVKLTQGDVTNKVTAGFGATYTSRTIDFSRLVFEDQFVGNGFDTNLPTGEVSLSSMHPYFSANTGITYSVTTEKSNFDIGVAGFHVNQPKQTWLKDPMQRLNVRKVAHANYETFLNERWVLNLNAIYQQQGPASYASAGGALGTYIDDEQKVLLNGGLWYWTKNAVVCYTGLQYGQWQFGFSYDATISKLNQAATKPNTFEVAIIIRGIREFSGIIPCPWK